MDFKMMTYDMCRCYIDDWKDSISADLISATSGWCRSRSIEKLSAASVLFDQAKHGLNDLRYLMQIEAFFKKNAAFCEPLRTHEAALKTFRLGEQLCRETNERLNDECTVDFGHYGPYIDKSREFIARVLGNYEDFLEQVPYRLRFTGGATSRRGRSLSRADIKVRADLDCTRRARPLLRAAAAFYGLQFTGREVCSNRVEFVPKNWKTSRTIACEPEGNVPFQLAFDSWVKDRLRRKTRIDLGDQSKNRDLARRGSIDGSLATIDLSMASDTLSYELVRWLLPPDWFDYVDRVRTPFGRVDGTLLKYQKFSSMGNGTTFPLETLIFASACYAVGSREFSVYGDDIIIETELADELIQLLGYYGFMPNEEKSFTSGPFRESCGGNFFEGVDITPFYVRDIDRRKPVLSHLVNGLTSLTYPSGSLFAFLETIVRGYELRFVPFNNDSMSGVWCSASAGYEGNIIRKRRNKCSSSLWYKQYQTADAVGVSARSSSYLLWHLDVQSMVLRGGRGAASCVVRSRYSIPLNTYVRKWVRWQPPTVVVPVSVYHWDSYAARPSGLAA